MSKNPKKFFKTVLIFSFVFIISAYTLFQAWKMLTGPSISIQYPSNGSTVHSPLIEISGRAKNSVFFSINNRNIALDKKGYFKEQLLLSPGYNILKLEAKDKFGAKKEKRIELILKEY